MNDDRGSESIGVLLGADGWRAARVEWSPPENERKSSRRALNVAAVLIGRGVWRWWSILKIQ